MDLIIKRILIGFSWLFFLAWVAFLFITKKEPIDYARPIPQLPFTIDMRAEGNWPGFVVSSGFAVPEGWGRWSEGRRAELRFRGPQFPKTTYNMVLVMSVVTPKNKSQTISILFNGRLVRSFSYNNNVFNEYVYLSTAPLVRDKNLLVLEISSPLRPADYDPQSHDLRRLGLALHSVIFVPAESSRSKALPFLFPYFSLSNRG